MVQDVEIDDIPSERMIVRVNFTLSLKFTGTFIAKLRVRRYFLYNTKTSDSQSRILIRSQCLLQNTYIVYVSKVRLIGNDGTETFCISV